MDFKGLQVCLIGFLVRFYISLAVFNLAVFTFTNAELRKATTHWLIRFKALVTEAVTGYEQETYHRLNVDERDVEVYLQYSTDTYKPDLDYDMLVGIKRKDGASIAHMDIPRLVQLTETYEFTYDDQILNTSHCTSRVLAQYDRSGKNNFRESTFLNDDKTYFTLKASQSPSQSFIQLISTANSTNAGENVKFLLVATKSFRKLYAHVISRNRIVLSTSFPMDGTEASIEFNTTPDMAPSAKLVVFGVRDDTAEVVADGMQFNVEEIFNVERFLRNKVSITVDPTKVEPQQTIKFTIKADPDAFVGLMAVDESVRLFGTGNDIEAEHVINSFGGGRIAPISHPSSLGGKIPSDVFAKAQLRVLTDAYLYGYDSTLNRGSTPVPGGTGGAGGAGGPPTETWIWTDLVSNADGEAILEAKVPDTITTYTASAFAVHQTSGIGVARNLAKVTVFRSFFIQMDLPYSVKRGEKMALQILVFNFEEKPQTTVVELFPDGGFAFLDNNESPVDPANVKQGYNIRKLTIQPGESSAVYFPIQPTKIGHVMLRVQALGVTVSDAVERLLLVEPEGYLVEQNQPFVIGVDSVPLSVDLAYPANAVADSKRAYVNIIGDIMGPIMGNTDRLVRMPDGCGEQNMINFVPYIVVLKYLDATKRQENELRARALNHLRRGYQRQHYYRRWHDDSYSAFGSIDHDSSYWLTAFILRSFVAAKPFLDYSNLVDVNLIAYLKSMSLESGMFFSIGEAHIKYMQREYAAGGVSLTAYVTIVLLEVNVTVVEPSSATPSLDNVLKSSITFLESNLDALVNEPYGLAITSYALHLADSPEKDKAWEMLNTLAVKKNDMQYWTDIDQSSRRRNIQYYWDGPRSVDVEMTGYALLTMMQRRDTNGALPVVRWLNAKRNTLGGWASTQDTVVALQALAEYAAAVYSPEIDLKLNIENGDATYLFSVNQDNQLLYQTFEVPNVNEPVKLSVNPGSKGVAFAQVQWTYHMTAERPDKPFECQQEVTQLEPYSGYSINLCCKYKNGARSNMVVMEFDTLSGYTINTKKLNEITRTKHLQRVETEKGDTKANIYFDYLQADVSTCFDIRSEIVYGKIGNLKDASVVLYDYYDTDDRIEMKYNLKKKPDLTNMCPDCWTYEL